MQQQPLIALTMAVGVEKIGTNSPGAETLAGLASLSVYERNFNQSV
jgi:hypothetical protein